MWKPDDELQSTEEAAKQSVKWSKLGDIDKRSHNQ